MRVPAVHTPLTRRVTSCLHHLMGSCKRAQVPFRYNPVIGTPPFKRTGYYYLPSGWRNGPLPVMVLLHGLEGYGISILNSGSIGTFQVPEHFALCSLRSPAGCWTQALECVIGRIRAVLCCHRSQLCLLLASSLTRACNSERFAGLWPPPDVALSMLPL